MDLRPGETFSVEALLFALLLDSSNDAAVALAEHVAGSEGAFVDDMNALAAELGATDTNYVTAHGLDMPGHGSSARDLAAIADELLADPLLARIVATSDTRIEGRGGVLIVENRNLLLEGYPGATGVKTGFTAGAGHVLVASAERDGRRIIAVAMGSVDATADAAALLDFGWQQIAETVVLPRGKEVGAIVFDHGSTPVVAARPVRDSVAPKDITYLFRPEGRVPLPVSPGDVLGRVIVTSDEGMVDSVEAVAAGAVPQEADRWVSRLFAGLLRTVGNLVTAR